MAPPSAMASAAERDGEEDPGQHGAQPGLSVECRIPQEPPGIVAVSGDRVIRRIDFGRPPA
jgi:hypothetical protein